MKAKHFLMPLISIFFIVFFTACEKNENASLKNEVISPSQSSTPCELNDSHYLNTGWAENPSDTLICDMFFETWFINPVTGQCVKAGYSGCEPEGFPTQEACEECAPEVPCQLNEDHFLQTAFPPLDPDTAYIDCMAYFVTWFIDRDTGECIEVGYSGCESKGFKSPEDCERCAGKL